MTTFVTETLHQKVDIAEVKDKPGFSSSGTEVKLSEGDRNLLFLQ